MSKLVVALTGGGSGGHFYPLMAVAEELNELKNADQEIDIYYLGPIKYNQKELERNNLKFVKIPAGKRTKYFSLGNIFTPFKILTGTIKAIFKLYFIYPDVLFSKGSYTSVPVVLAAAFLRIPIIIHESDTKVGSANRLAAKFARYIGIAYDDVAKFFPANKTALVGIPLRQEILNSTYDQSSLGIPNDRPVILVTGGSMGAQRINELILNSLDELLPEFTIIHQVGEKNTESVKQTSGSLITSTELLSRYFVVGSLDSTQMNQAMNVASLIISRAGSGTIFEIAQKGKPSIIIPIPEDISHDQRTNAYAYVRSGAASVLEEENLTDDLLTNEIKRIMGDQAAYEKMSQSALSFAKPDAAKKLTEAILTIGNEH